MKGLGAFFSSHFQRAPVTQKIHCGFRCSRLPGRRAQWLNQYNCSNFEPYYYNNHGGPHCY